MVCTLSILFWLATYLCLFLQDKTFGLKNKKGAKQQKFIQQVQHQVKSSGINKTAKQLEKEREDAKKEKEKKRLELLELNSILKPVQQAAGKGIMMETCLVAKII